MVENRMNLTYTAETIIEEQIDHPFKRKCRGAKASKRVFGCHLFPSCISCERYKKKQILDITTEAKRDLLSRRILQQLLDGDLVTGQITKRIFQSALEKDYAETIGILKALEAKGTISSVKFYQRLKHPSKSKNYKHRKWTYRWSYNKKHLI